MRWLRDGALGSTYCTRYGTGSLLPSTVVKSTEATSLRVSSTLSVFGKKVQKERTVTE